MPAVRPERDLHAGLDGLREVLPLCVVGHLGLLHDLVRVPEPRALLDHPVAVEHVGDEVGAVARPSDRSSRRRSSSRARSSGRRRGSRASRPPRRARARRRALLSASASSTAARISSSVSSGSAGFGPGREDRARRDHLDEVGAGVEDPPDVRAHLVGPGGDAHPQLARHGDVGRQPGDVAAPARAGHVRAGAHHPGPGDPAVLDRLAEREVDERVERPHVADGGEARRAASPGRSSPR